MLPILLVACMPAFQKTQRKLPKQPALVEQIDLLLDDTLFISTQVAIKVVSVDNRDVLYDRNSTLLFHPASNMKLFTSATALVMLDEEFTLNTALFMDGIVEDSVLNGNIYLKGFGDPLLDSVNLATIAREFASRGISFINGNLVGDVSYFDDLYWGNGWMWDDEPEPTEMFITPLSVNHNTITVFVRPGMRSGDPAVVQAQPATRYVEILNEAITVQDTVREELEVTRLWRDRSNVIHVTGEILETASPEKQTLSVWKPELYLLTLFDEELQRHGVVVSDDLKIETVPDDAHEMFKLERPIDSVVVYLNKESDNLSAENILKTLGAEFLGHPGTAENGILIMRDFIAALGIDTTRFTVADGSGVSRYNLVSAETIIEVLLAMTWNPEIFKRFSTSLSIAGVDGTLENRMKGTIAEGNARAKTGTLRGVSNLSGYVTTRDGELLAFSILMQNYLDESKPYTELQDRIVTMLADYSRKVPIARR